MDPREFKRRRKRLMQAVGDGGIAILPTAPIRARNRDIDFPFRADSDFYYLTGFPEPEAVAVFVPGRDQGEFLLFCRERDLEMETWNGPRAGLEGAMETFGADDAFPYNDLDDIIPGLLENKERIYYNMGSEMEFDKRVLGWVNEIRRRVRAGVSAPDEFFALSHILHEMRLVKSRYEIKQMRHAAGITCKAHRRAMTVTRPGLTEFQVEAELQYAFMRAGARSPAYPSIVGAGANSCILHYTANSAPLADGDLLLIDAGAEFDGYAADVTRTFPVNGEFSPVQREAYEVVLEAQEAAIKKVKPGNHWNDPHDAAVRVLTKGLIDMKILKGRLSKLITDRAYRPYYMHRTGHWLGMDVHDVGEYKRDDHWRTFEPGMVLTVEPGLYLSSSIKGLAKRWWNIGIRIEDDVVVTRDGHEVLTEDAPKHPDLVEDQMANAQAA